jgi:hypothetical protein
VIKNIAGQLGQIIRARYAFARPAIYIIGGPHEWDATRD